MEFQFLITKTQDRTFLQTFKVRIQVIWCKKNTASHKKVHIPDWKLMAHTWLSSLDPYPHDAVWERSTFKPSLLFLILYPAKACSLSFLLSTSKPKPWPEAFFGCKCQCSHKRRWGECCFDSLLIYRGHQEHEPSLGLVMCSCLWSFVFLN